MGSTSVEGLYAKSIIDVVIDSYELLPPWNPEKEDLIYEENLVLRGESI